VTIVLLSETNRKVKRVQCPFPLESLSGSKKNDVVRPVSIFLCLESVLPSSLQCFNTAGWATGKIQLQLSVMDLFRESAQC